MHALTPTPADDCRGAIRYSYTALFLLCFAYILIMSAASLFSSLPLNIFMQVLAVVVPLLLARFLPFIRVSGCDKRIGFSPKPLLTTLWLLPVFIGCVVALSLASAKLASLTGTDTTYPFGDSVVRCILVSACLPAVTEELFCRYIFLPRLSMHSRSGAIFASALFFSFMHGNFFQIPYALVAGILLGALAVGSGSILPCILFHFVNNLTSILLHFYGDTVLPQVLLYVLLGGLVVSVVCGVILRRPLWQKLREVFACDRMTGYTVLHMFTTPVVIYLVVFIASAVIERFT